MIAQIVLFGLDGECSHASETRKIEDQINSKKTMWMSGLVIAASVCASTLLAGANQATPSATSLAMPKVEQEVREAVAQFYVALNELFASEMKPMNDVWSHADDVT